MQCSIIIRAYNEAKHIGRLLEGVTRQTAVNAEVIVVDSGSSDGTIQIAQKFAAKVISISSDEFSFGRALNLGLQAAAYEYAVIASAHVHPVYPDWIECLLRPFADNRVAVVYGKQRGLETSRFSERQIFRQWYPNADVLNQVSPFCNNANAAIRRSLWTKHPYDEMLTGLEDVAWAKWAQEQGYHISYAAHAEIIHVHNETDRAIYDRYRREAMAFKRIFPGAHFSAYDFVRLTATNILSDLRDAARGREFWRHPASIMVFRTLQFLGTYQGYRHSGPVTHELRQRFYYPGGHLPEAVDKRNVEAIRYDSRS